MAIFPQSPADALQAAIDMQRTLSAYNTERVNKHWPAIHIGIGMHTGYLPGYAASHGCIRMPRGEVQAFFKMLKIGDPVTIEP